MPKRYNLSTKHPVTETELAILEVLWKDGASTVREIVQAIYGRHTASLHATVNSLIDRLGEKGHVTVADAGFARQYAAAVTREALVGETLQQLADRHFDGAVTPLMLTLIDRFQLSRKDRDAIRKIISGIK